jgi:hypothetical protein
MNTKAEEVPACLFQIEYVLLFCLTEEYIWQLLINLR